MRIFQNLLCLSSAMDVLKKQSRKKVLKKARPKKNNQERSNMNSRSNILKKIIKYLENGECQHMLYWKNKLKREFVIKFVHMNSQEFKKADYLKLFRDLDKMSNKYEEYMKDDKYNHNCKVRCKSNLKKLCGKALTFLEKYNESKSIQIRRYRLNDESLLVVNNLSEEENLIKQCNIIISLPYKIMENSTLYSSGSCSSIENNDKCDSMESSELFAPNIQDSVTNQKIVSLPVMPLGNSALYNSVSCSSIDKIDKYESMECSQVLAKIMQDNIAIQNVVTPPTIPMEYSALNSLNTYSSFERNGNFELMEEFGKSLPSRIKGTEEAFNVGTFQGTNGGIKNKPQMVPSFPLELKGNFHESLSECNMDVDFYCDKLLSKNDPFLSSASSNISSNKLSEENYLSSDAKVFLSDLDNYFSSYHTNL